jgi:uncharacterized protein with PQ loop repeat
VRAPDLLVIVATGLAWWSLIPQIARLVRTGDPTGVSQSWPAIGLASNAGWSVYLGREGLWPAVPSTVVMTVFYALVMWAMRRAGGPIRRGALVGLAWAGTLGSTALVAGNAGMGLLLAGSYVLQFTPAVVAAYRVRRPTGVSPATWASIGVESALWGAYGWLNGDLPVVLYGVAGVLTTLLIVGRQASMATPGRARGSDSTKQV